MLFPYGYRKTQNLLLILNSFTSVPVPTVLCPFRCKISVQ